MNKSTSKVFIFGLTACALLPFASSANPAPPQVTSTSGEPISVRLNPGHEARCFKESKTRERGNWAVPKTTLSNYTTAVEVRNGVEFIAMTLPAQQYQIKVLMELSPNGTPRKVPPLLETSMPGFEKEYGAALAQMTRRLIASSNAGEGFLGRSFEIGRTYGPTIDLCLALASQPSGATKGSTTVDGTLTYSGRPAYLVSQTYEQACTENDVRFSVEGASWAVYDIASGLTLSSFGQFNVFAQGNRITQIDETVECGIAPMK